MDQGHRGGSLESVNKDWNIAPHNPAGQMRRCEEVLRKEI